MRNLRLILRLIAHETRQEISINLHGIRNYRDRPR